jgi:hypothetical protein
MTWKQIKAEALRIVDEVAQRKSDLELTEYQNKGRYRADHPAGMTMRDHNAVGTSRPRGLKISRGPTRSGRESTTNVHRRPVIAR